ncbi:MAG: esterase/lipase family protein [Isosphaerales bacterium]
MPWPRQRAAAIACLLIIAPAGCTDIKARDPRLRNAIEDGWERVEANHGLNVGFATCSVLARLGLLAQAQQDPAAAASLLETRLQTQCEPDGSLALAELSYHVGLACQTGSPAASLAWYRDAAALATLSLADPAGTRPDVALTIHNRAVARLVRIAQANDVRQGRSWRQILSTQEITVRSSTPFLDPEQVADLRVASDYRVEGMDHVYCTTGLGVPLIAHRFAERSDLPDPPDPRNQFFPREMRVGATAVLTPAGGLRGGQWRRGPAMLVLFDPFWDRSHVVGQREIVLASDRTTPLVVQMARRDLVTLEWTGLFESDFKRKGVDTGLYLLHPYEPGKIPVVFVHGLVSSPRAWVQTINEFRNTPALAARYQFWMFLYPTGKPIPTSAARLREALAQVRDTFDPNHDDRAFDRMVLVGHSMGGLLSKMMVQDSELTLWDATITVPHDRFKAPPELQKTLDEVLIFQRLPNVSRVVFIATPHRGSPIADSRFGQAVSDIVRRPAQLDANIAELEALNGPDVISSELRGHALNAISNLRTDSPILAALARIPIHQSVSYHSILPLIGGSMDTDGVVEYRSSHLEGAASESIVAGTHLSQQDPDVIRELDRILRQHAATTRSTDAAAEGN